MLHVLIQQRTLAPYRVPLFNALSERVSLTVLHGDSPETHRADLKFTTSFSRVRWLWPFYIQFLPTNYEKFDIVVIESNLRNIVGNLLSLLPFRKIRCVTWGIGVSASLDKKFNQDRKWDFLRLLLYRHADSVIFYSAPAANHFTSKGLASKKVFVAENTVSVNYSNYKTFVRDKFIFLGSLYPQKGLEELMLAYSLYLEKVRNPISLFIIGEGSDRGSIEAWIAANSLEDLVTMLGEVREEVALEYYIRTALCCISPRQAGLSVLKSIGYGTPFVTRRDAVTGGELFNIIHRFNGLLYDRTEELVNILIDATVFPGNYEAMGSNGRDYYLENCSIDMFVSSFLGAFEVATSSKPQLSP